jgi:hypothetical protein
LYVWLISIRRISLVALLGDDWLRDLYFEGWSSCNYFELFLFIVLQGFNIKESKHVYNGVVTIGYPNDHQLKNVEDFESLGVLRRSFIPCHNRQQDHLEHIESLGECNSNFLFPKEVVNCEVEVGTVRKFIVAEEMVTVEEYFADQLQKYLKSKEWEVETFVKMSKNDRLDILRDWWKHISSKFISIFRYVLEREM